MEILQGIPSIVIGIIAYVWVVMPWAPSRLFPEVWPWGS